MGSVNSSNIIIGSKTLEENNGGTQNIYIGKNTYSTGTRNILIGNSIDNADDDKIIIGSQNHMMQIKGGVNWNVDKIEGQNNFTFINQTIRPAQFYFFDNTLTSVTLPSFISNITYQIKGLQIIFKRKYQEPQTPPNITFYTDINIIPNYDNNDNQVSPTISYPSRIFDKNNTLNNTDKIVRYLDVDYTITQPYLIMPSSVYTITFICDGTDWYQI